MIRQSYAINNIDNKVYHINDSIVTKHSDNFSCPECGKKLIVKKGNIKEHHFAHDKNSECSNPKEETLLHLLSKEIVENSQVIFIPDGTFFKGSQYNYTKVNSEETIENIKPDIILEDELKNKLIIEIYVTHKIDDDKLDKMKKINIPTIEIDLSKFQREFDYDELKSFILNDKSSKKWIIMPDEKLFKDFVCNIPCCPSKNSANYCEDCKKLNLNFNTCNLIVEDMVQITFEDFIKNRFKLRDSLNMEDLCWKIKEEVKSKKVKEKTLEDIFSTKMADRLRIRLGNYIRDYGIKYNNHLISIDKANSLDRVKLAKNFYYHLFNEYKKWEVKEDHFYYELLNYNRAYCPGYGVKSVENNVNEITTILASEIDRLLPCRYFVAYCLENNLFKNKKSGQIKMYWNPKNNTCMYKNIDNLIGNGKLKYQYNHYFVE